MLLKKTLFVLICFCSISVFSQVNTRHGNCGEISIPEGVGICGDGVGNVWSIYFPCAPEKFSISIYDRWGNELFTSDNYKFQWTVLDANQKPLSPGVYAYALKYTIQGEEKTLSGNVSVIC